MQPSNPALGPIRELMEDPDVTEIMINGPEQVYVERHGLMELTGMRFADAATIPRPCEAKKHACETARKHGAPFSNSRNHVAGP